jgi:hypothetical protein
LNDLNYTLLEDLSILGGSVRHVLDLDTGEIATGSAEVSCKQETARGRAPLSTTHKRPFVEWTAGASLLKVSGGGDFERQGGGKKKPITGFSKGSRRRLMQTIARIKPDGELPCFVTLTYPDKFPEPRESKKHLKTFIKRLLRAHPLCGVIWKLEPQERGAPHYHMMVWGVENFTLCNFVVESWHDIAGAGDENHKLFHAGLLAGSKPCVEPVRSWRGVWSYASKYLGKTFEIAGWDSLSVGRYWAVIQKQNIPFGQQMVMRITIKDAHVWMRYQRRFMGLKSRSYPSLTTFCKADDWINNLMRSGEVQENQT